ncbi:hypothetical protein JMJ55_02555 [Belnapia sp. T6]|uniref:Uncharacterized protein n=1 Tax=Belnapia mucosa TaxID=2804532 RepID=A0ABS1UXK0_9PROT|nr:hypothetical protein [Belnapia mucosa]MBL6454187.1 hypothetical protein [Belnapia mucosa]
MPDDLYDDGLVHSHHWATEPMPFRGDDQPMPAAPPGLIVHAPDDDAHDEGLVHSHGWACSERGRMAHG